MADEPHVIRAIEWREIFPWTHIFRAFRIAIHPSKLLLGALLLILLYAGGCLLDALWASNDRAVPNEVALWRSTRNQPDSQRTFASARSAARKSIVNDYAQLLYGWEGAPTSNRDEALKAAQEGKYLSRVKEQILKGRDKDIERLNKSWQEFGSKATGADRVAAQRQRDQAIASLYSQAQEAWTQAKAIKGVGIFSTFFEYESNQLNNIMWAVTAGQWLDTGAGISVSQSLVNFVYTGPAWLLDAHTLYFVIWIFWLLILWSIFGGAIARIAALHVAADEKLSIRQALRFSTTKALSFISAPLIPLLIILVIGVLVGIVSLLGNIPWIGPILIGIPFALALVAGFIMTLMLIGTIAGFTLMYPTVAVEGSDSFDAISRSFSYIYARPWRMLFYSAIAIGYGALCYLFVRIFVYLVLSLTHASAGLGMFANVAPGISLWPSLWPAPSFQNLPHDIGFLSLNGGSAIGAWFIALWVYLLLALMGAFVISFFFSANTIIYYLMRREVDATGLDDVYHDQADDEFAESAIVTETTTVTATVQTTPAEPVSDSSVPASSDAASEAPTGAGDSASSQDDGQSAEASGQDQSADEPRQDKPDDNSSSDNNPSA